VLFFTLSLAFISSLALLPSHSATMVRPHHTHQLAAVRCQRDVKAPFSSRTPLVGNSLSDSHSDRAAAPAFFASVGCWVDI
jgi:hypothetical protein